ncbi:MAG: DnaJ domain-containing protein [Candidatus Theseobacter exili]|nr:DnaJ domain-containing protein [Candidatus Theseobacter exili]
MKIFIIWYLAVLYFIFSWDLFPDFLSSFGRIDDLAVLALTAWLTHRFLKGKGRKTQKDQTKKKQGRHTSGGEEDKVNAFEEDPYKILGIVNGCSVEEIRSAYKKLAAQYHPDKVQHLGKEFQELAHKKFVKIQEAYECLTGTSKKRKRRKS